MLIFQGTNEGNRLTNEHHENNSPQHDAGTFQKILQEGRITLMTTATILGSFLRKYAALSDLDEDFLRNVFIFRQVRIGEFMKIRGGLFRFFYSLHSIPCIGFEVHFGEKSIVFSADHMNDPGKIREMRDAGILSSARCEELLNFPWHHDLILHESGVPPIHTPIETLAQLSEDVKSRLYVVHTTQDKFPEGSNLRVAVTGVENTIVLDAKTHPHSAAIEVLDLLSSIDIFKNLSLHHAREVLTIARSEHFEAGQAVITRGEIGDSFYVISSGVAEVRVARRRGKSSSSSSVAGSEPGTPVSEYGSGSPNPWESPPPSPHPPSGAAGEGASVRPPAPAAAASGGSGGPASSTLAAAAFALAGSAGARGPGSARAVSGTWSPGAGTDDGGDPRSVTVKVFTTGDYFGEQALISSATSVRSADIYAVTDLSVIRFHRADFHWLLDGTRIIQRMKHLAEMRQESIWETLECNSVLAQLSASQKTQLEEYFSKVVLEQGQPVWSAGEQATCAVLVDSGAVRFSSDPRLVGLGEEEDGGRYPARVTGDSGRRKRRPRTPMPFTMTRGAFLADVERAVERRREPRVAVATCETVVHVLQRKDVLHFFSSNPGVLLSVLHTHFII